MTGFQLVTADSSSYIIDKSSANFPLKTIATQTQTLQYSEFAPTGDLNGNFVGTVGYENTVQITLGMLFPLQPLCVFTFKFPKEMKINAISRITGDGIFKPENGQSQTG